MIMAAKEHYWDKKKGKDGHGEGKPEGMHERHGRERGEAHQRHAKARDDMHKQHEAEMEQMASRQASEMEAGPGTPGGTAEPAAINNAAAGAAAGTPPAVSGANAG